jgi:hypothetical protein
MRAVMRDGEVSMRVFRTFDDVVAASGPVIRLVAHETRHSE